MGEELPKVLQRHLDRALLEGSSSVRLVRLTQAGEMFKRPGGDPLPFRATEELKVGEVAFEWRARVRTAPLVSARVVDRYAEGEGLLSARIWGLIPMMRSAGPDLSKGEAMRYLAELPWVPHAIVANPDLRWRRIGRSSAEVATTAAGRPVGVRLDFKKGEIVRALGDRPRLERGKAIETPWIGEFADYEVLNGVRVPTRAQASWLLDEGPFTYWRGEVTSLQTE